MQALVREVWRLHQPWKYLFLCEGECRCLDNDCEQDNGKAIGIRHSHTINATLQCLQKGEHQNQQLAFRIITSKL